MSRTSAWPGPATTNAHAGLPARSARAGEVSRTCPTRVPKNSDSSAGTQAQPRTASAASEQVVDAYIHRAWMRLAARPTRPSPAGRTPDWRTRLRTCSVYPPPDRAGPACRRRGVGGRRGPARHAGRVAGRDAGPPHRDALVAEDMAAMAIEEMLRDPIDGIVLLGGCAQDHPRPADGGRLTCPRWSCPAARCSPARSAACRWAAGPTCGGWSERGRPRGQAVPGGVPPVRSFMVPQPRTPHTMGTASTMGLLAEGARHDAARHGLALPSDSLLLGERKRPARWRLMAGTAWCSARRCRPRRSATPSWPLPRSAARRTLSCTCWPSRGAWDTRLAGRFRPDRATVPLLVNLQPAAST